MLIVATEAMFMIPCPSRVLHFGPPPPEDRLTGVVLEGFDVVYGAEMMIYTACKPELAACQRSSIVYLPA